MNAKNLDYPKIRFVDAFPVETEQGNMIGLRDPSGIASQVFVLSPDIFYLLQFFDGKHSNIDICYKYSEFFGNFLYEEQLSQILQSLDTHLFLENQNYLDKLRTIEDDFKALPFRPAIHAGQSYDSDPVKLRNQIKSFFTSAQGACVPVLTTGKKAIKGLIAPHIDLKAGGPCYSFAYKDLAESTGADCFIILGTGHSVLKNLYSTLSKDFDTPLGIANCDLEFQKLLTANYGGDVNSEILSHKTEHTIEFQLIFLQYLYQNNLDFTFVPILSSFSYHMLDRNQFPKERKIIDSFISALRKTIDQFGKKVCLIASADLSHVGPRYGDQDSPDASFLAQVTELDHKILNYVEKLDGDGFYRCIEEYQDQYRVCGFSSIYTLLNVVDAKKSKLLDYSKTVVDSHNSTVTFASMVFK